MGANSPHERAWSDDELINGYVEEFDVSGGSVEAGAWDVTGGDGLTDSEAP